MIDEDDIYDDSSFQEWDSSNYDEYDDDEDRLADYIYQEEEEEW